MKWLFATTRIDRGSPDRPWVVPFDLCTPSNVMHNKKRKFSNMEPSLCLSGIKDGQFEGDKNGSYRNKQTVVHVVASVLLSSLQRRISHNFQSFVAPLKWHRRLVCKRPQSCERQFVFLRTCFWCGIFLRSPGWPAGGGHLRCLAYCTDGLELEIY